MNTGDILTAMVPIVGELEQLKVPYYIGGSVASSVHGLPRLTLDVDIVAALKPQHVSPLVRTLKDTYYIDADMILDAINT